LRRINGTAFGDEYSELDRRAHQAQRITDAAQLADLCGAVTTYENPVRGRPDVSHEHGSLGDRPVAVENHPRVGGANAGWIDVADDTVVKRRPVGELDRRRHVAQLAGVPGVGEACARQGDQGMQPVARRAARGRPLDEPDAVLDLIELGAQVARQSRRDRAELTGRLVDKITPSRHATSPTLAPVRTLAPGLTDSQRFVPSIVRSSRSNSWSEYGHRSSADGAEQLRALALPRPTFPL